MFVPIGKYCSIIIVKGEADRDYRTRVLAQEVYLMSHCTILHVGAQWDINKCNVCMIWYGMLYFHTTY
jgi:hypothetical protein